MSHASLMDGVYRYQRHIYDLTRKYFLFGRDRLIRDMPIQTGENVLEMGCGTARNLLKLVKKHPNTEFYGLDASAEMLVTANEQIKKAGVDQQVQLIQCLAEDLNYKTSFGLEQPFDRVFFSYALTMIPPWQEAIDVALENVRSGGTLHIVDFSDQRDLPAAFRFILKRWLALFHVYHKPELLPYLETLQAEGKGTLKIESLGGYYAFLAHFEKK